MPAEPIPEQYRRPHGMDPSAPWPPPMGDPYAYRYSDGTPHGAPDPYGTTAGPPAVWPDPPQPPPRTPFWQTRLGALALLVIMIVIVAVIWPHR